VLSNQASCLQVGADVVAGQSKTDADLGSDYILLADNFLIPVSVLPPGTTIPGGRLLRSVTSGSGSAGHSPLPVPGGVALSGVQAPPVKLSLPGVDLSASCQMTLPDVSDGASVLPSVSASLDEETAALVKVDASWSAILDLE
jgi:hypothetical protein